MAAGITESDSLSDDDGVPHRGCCGLDCLLVSLFLHFQNLKKNTKIQEIVFLCFPFSAYVDPKIHLSKLPKR